MRTGNRMHPWPFVGGPWNGGLAAVDNEAIQRLEQRLQTIPEDELEAYYYIIK